MELVDGIDKSPMPFGCVAYEATSHENRNIIIEAMSPMPFGCVAYEASGDSEEVNTLKGGSPMPFGCVAYEATSRRFATSVRASIVSNAFRLCGL